MHNFEINVPIGKEIKQWEQLTILQAVAQAGGFSEQVAKTKVNVVRQTRIRRKKAFKINM